MNIFYSATSQYEVGLSKFNFMTVGDPFSETSKLLIRLTPANEKRISITHHRMEVSFFFFFSLKSQVQSLVTFTRSE